MKIAPLPESENERISKLGKYDILDTPPEHVFDRITRLVSQLIDVPIALVSLVDSERQWFKSKQGLDALETPRDIAFCAHAILEDGIFVIDDTLADPRFADNPLVTSDPKIRFYAGAPLRTQDGFKLGTLCAIDRKPRKLSEDQRQVLMDLASVVVDEMELRLALKTSMHRVSHEVELQSMKDEFVSTVSHELRTPLTSIRGTLGLLESGELGELPDKVHDLISIANRNAVNLIGLVNDLLNIQEIESGSLTFDFGTFLPNDLLEEVCQNLSGLALQKNVTIVCDAEECLGIMGDRSRIGQVLTNLISNAVKFSLNGQTVSVSMSKTVGAIKYIISDDGPGIPEDFRKNAFKRFARAKAHYDVPGTGLGLAISKAIVDAHDGKIDYESHEGQGTRFSVELPISRSIA